MKYLIIGNACSVHVYNFIKNILISRGYDIYILSHAPHPIPQQYKNYYADNNIKVFHPGRKWDPSGKLGSLVRLLRRLYFLIKIGKCDICNIQYATILSCKFYLWFRRFYKHLILSYWGTDILKPSTTELKYQKQVLNYTDAITVTVEHSRKVFVNRFGDNYSNKLHIARFPAGSMDPIEKAANSYTRDYCRAQFGVKENEICVVAGYNADPSQHQDIILTRLRAVPEDIRKKLHVIVPMQYDRTSLAYITRVKDEAGKCDFPVDVLEEYVPFERNAIMYLATDVYLNLRDSDAFSNAMKEQIFSGSTMIQGSWLVYEEMDECKAPVIKIDAIDDLDKAISELLQGWNYSSDVKLFYPIYDIFSVKAANLSWDRILNKIL